MRIFDAQVVPDVRIGSRSPGKVIFLDEGVPTVVCGHALLRLLEIRDHEGKASLLPLNRLRTRFS